MDTLIYLAWAVAVPLTYVGLVELVDRLAQRGGKKR